MTQKMLDVHPITPQLFNAVSKLNRWNFSRFNKGQAVQKHSHKFDAMYFVNGVKEVCSGGSRIALPEFAAVFIPKGAEHGWNGIASGKTEAVVGHFHDGHGVHEVVPEY